MWKEEWTYAASKLACQLWPWCWLYCFPLAMSADWHKWNRCRKSCHSTNTHTLKPCFFCFINITSSYLWLQRWKVCWSSNHTPFSLSRGGKHKKTRVSVSISTRWRQNVNVKEKQVTPFLSLQPLSRVSIENLVIDVWNGKKKEKENETSKSGLEIQVVYNTSGVCYFFTVIL